MEKERWKISEGYPFLFCVDFCFYRKQTDVAKQAITRIDTHTYSDSRRGELRQICLNFLKGYIFEQICVKIDL